LQVNESLLRLTEDCQQRFLSLWLLHIIEDDWLYYNITSVSSYSRHNEYTRFGYNRDGESLKQINLAMFFGQKNHFPAHDQHLPGNISNVSTKKRQQSPLIIWELGSCILFWIKDYTALLT